MIANFKNLKVEVAFEEFKELDIRKVLGNVIHTNTSDIGLDDVARAIYHSDGNIDISEEYACQIVEFMKDNNCVLLAAVKKAVINELTVKG